MAQPGATISDRRQLVSYWYEAHRFALGRYLLRLLGDVQQAEDALHDTFVRALSAVSPANPPDNPMAWLHRIATNVAYTALRRRARLSWLPFIGREAQLEGGQVESQVVLTDAIRRCLARLGTREAEALLLFEYGGLSCGEIAALAGEEPNAVRVRIFRARRRFRELYMAEKEYER